MLLEGKVPPAGMGGWGRGGGAGVRRDELICTVVKVVSKFRTCEQRFVKLSQDFCLLINETTYENTVLVSECQIDFLD